MKRILVATTNQGKLSEYQSLLGDLQLELVSPDDIGVTLDVVEDGNTFEENAIIKAKAYAKETGLLTLADDSGLEVDVLGGKPGIHTARFGGVGLTPKERWQLLLERMKNVPFEDRTARFRCVVALSTPDGNIQT
ncbi:MAG: non-canonical purine NTP pyrophosphatase, partial [Chloroflexota bacterium]